MRHSLEPGASNSKVFGWDRFFKKSRTVVQSDADPSDGFYVVSDAGKEFLQGCVSMNADLLVGRMVLDLFSLRECLLMHQVFSDDTMRPLMERVRVFLFKTIPPIRAAPFYMDRSSLPFSGASFRFGIPLRDERLTSISILSLPKSHPLRNQWSPEENSILTPFTVRKTIHAIWEMSMWETLEALFDPHGQMFYRNDPFDLEKSSICNKQKYMLEELFFYYDAAYCLTENELPIWYKVSYTPRLLPHPDREGFRDELFACLFLLHVQLQWDRRQLGELFSSPYIQNVKLTNEKMAQLREACTLCCHVSELFSCYLNAICRLAFLDLYPCTDRASWGHRCTVSSWNEDMKKSIDAYTEEHKYDKIMIYRHIPFLSDMKVFVPLNIFNERRRGLFEFSERKSPQRLAYDCMAKTRWQPSDYHLMKKHESVFFRLDSFGLLHPLIFLLYSEHLFRFVLPQTYLYDHVLRWVSREWHIASALLHMPHMDDVIGQHLEAASIVLAKEAPPLSRELIQKWDAISLQIMDVLDYRKI